MFYKFPLFVQFFTGSRFLLSFEVKNSDTAGLGSEKDTPFPFKEICNIHLLSQDEVKTCPMSSHCYNGKQLPQLPYCEGQG